MIRAAYFDGPGRPFRLETAPPVTPGPGEAVVRVTLCTVCGSDLHTAAGRRRGPTPCVLGHEVVGLVEAAGAGFPVAAGRRVVVGVVAGCGVCFYCVNGPPQKCDSLVKYGHAAADPRRGPLGGLATHLHLLPGSTAVEVPDDLPDEVAAPAGCAAATAAAVLRAAGPGVWGGCVVVFGAGMLGLTAAAMSSAGGAAAVVVSDPAADRRVQALRFGATHAVPPGLDGLRDLTKRLTAGRGADAVLELSGSPAAAADGLDVLRPGGVAVWAGAVLPTAPVAVSPERVVRGCLTVAGVHNYAPADLRTSVAFLAAHHVRFPFAGLVTRTFPLDAVEDAFRHAERDRPVRVGVRP